MGRIAGLGLTALIAAGALACGPFAKLHKDLKRLDTDCVIRGEVHGAVAGGGKVYVAAIRRPSPELVEIADVTVLAPGEAGFAFMLPNGDDYYVAAFQDRSGDQLFQPGEPFWSYGAPGPVPIGADRYSPLLDAQLSTAAPELPPELLSAVRHARAGRSLVALKTDDDIPIAAGEIADLDAPRFSVEGGTQGLWQPVTFLAQRGIGVYFLEAYDPQRVPVLFVYGAGGSPQNFRHFFEKLDRSKYQAWFFLYPSGLRLAESSRILGRVVDALHAKLAFPRLDVVAHSMGGLVARRFLLDAETAQPRPWAHNFVTLSTPWSGHPAAALGVEYAPAVIPSWRDMEVGSPFTTDLFKARLAPPMTYCLGFTFHGRNGIGLPQDNDGAVGVASELRTEAQDEAIQMRGFDLTHTGVLESSAAAEFIASCLARESKSD
jgi:pimeloyl-ACP methyl ester carboxylesterase